MDLDGAKTETRKPESDRGPLSVSALYGGGRGYSHGKGYYDTLALGVDRVISGTAAVTDFDFTTRMGRKYGDRLAVGVDAKDGLWPYTVGEPLRHPQL